MRTHLAGMITGLDVRHDAGGPVGAGAHHPLLGARLPSARLTTRRGTVTTAALLRSGRGLLLDLTGAPGPAHEAARSRPDRVLARAGRIDEPDRAHPLHGLDAVLVRPDGHIVWVAEAGHGRPGTGGPESALRRWFGEPRPGAAPPEETGEAGE